MDYCNAVPLGGTLQNWGREHVLAGSNFKHLDDLKSGHGSSCCTFPWCSQCFQLAWACVLMIDSRGSQSLISFTHRFGSSTFVGRHPSPPPPPHLSLSHSHTLSMNTNAVSGPTSHPPIFLQEWAGEGRQQFQLSILSHEVGSAWLAATPLPFFSSSHWAIFGDTVRCHCNNV